MLANRPPLMPILRCMRHTDSGMPSRSSADFHASTCWYTLSISVPSRSNRNGVLLRTMGDSRKNSVAVSLRLFPRDRPMADVAPILHEVPMDGVDQRIRLPLSRADRIPEADRA